MSATSPKVRDACQNCHRRKIRCILTPGTSACNNCATSSSACLFAPRAKAGRPRRADSRAELELRRARQGSSSESRRTRQDSSPESPQAMPAPSSFENLAQESSSMSSSSLGEEGQFSSMMALETYWTSTESDVSELTDMDFHSQTNLSASQEPTQHSASEFMRPDLPSGHDPIFGLLTPATLSSSTPVHYDYFEIPDDRLKFDVTLKLCADLDHQCRIFRDARNNFQDVQPVMTLIEAACASASMAILSASASQRASTALIQAALYKSFELSERLVSHTLSASMSEEPDKFEQLVMLKRLDLALLQAKFFLTRMSQVEAAKKASQLHLWIESACQQQQYMSIW